MAQAWRMRNAEGWYSRFESKFDGGPYLRLLLSADMGWMTLGCLSSGEITRRRSSGHRAVVPHAQNRMKIANRRSPDCQSHVVYPFMDRYSRRVTVKLDFCTYCRPPTVTKCRISGIKGSGVSIDHQSLVGVSVIGEVGGDVQLDMMPSVYRPTARESRRCRYPLVVQRVPQPPNVATGIITLHRHVKLIAIHIPVGIIFKSLNAVSIVRVNPEVFQKIRD